VDNIIGVGEIAIADHRLSQPTVEEMAKIASAARIGSFVASLLTQKFKLYQLIIAGLLISGSFIIAASFAENTYLFLTLLFAAAFGLPLVNIAIGGWMPSIVDPKMMGRVQGWISPLMMLSQSITLGFIAVSFPSLLKVEMLYWMVGGCLSLVGVFYSLVLPKLTKKRKKYKIEFFGTNWYSIMN
jgi:MFS family permease